MTDPLRANGPEEIGDDRPITGAPGRTALLIIDMINDLDFAGGPDLLESGRSAAEAIRNSLCRDARRAGVPVVYVNDNYGHWHSERSKIIDYCMREEAPGRELVETILPEEKDYFVIKPQFSGFYATNLPVLLPRIGATRLILTGMATDICVLFTAADAHMREYDLWVPSDCTASSNPQRTGWALEIMKKSMHADVRPTSELILSDWLDQDARGPSS